MNRIFNFLTLIIISFVITFSSCKKDEPLKPNNSNTVITNDGVVEGVTWVLVSGRVYMENLDNGNLFVYDHFGGGIDESVLAVFDGYSIVKIDSIKQNYTTWFFNNGTFTLNGTNSYQYTEANGVYTPIGLEDGSSRPMEITHLTDEFMTVIVHENYASDGTSNFSFYSQLTFVKAGTTCNSCQPDVNYGYVYSGVWSSPNTSSPSLVGTAWVVTRYNNGLSGNVYPNDTLNFITQTTYKINNGSNKTYTLSNVIGNNNKSLSLYSFTTLGGDYSGQVISTFIGDSVINNSVFTDMFNVNNTVTVWMERIQ